MLALARAARGAATQAPARAFGTAHPCLCAAGVAKGEAGGGEDERLETDAGPGDVWVRQVDLASGRHYFFNKRTLEFRATEPTGVTVEYGRLPASLMSPEQAEKEESRHREPEWCVYMDGGTGRPFYFHTGTAESRWDNPCGISLLPEDYTGQPRAVPEELMVHPPLWRRLSAGAVDVGLSLGFGAVTGAIMAWELGAWQLGQLGGAFMAALALVARDAVSEQGTRSPGKRLLGLEIVRTSGVLPSRYRTVARNLYLSTHLATVELFPFLQAAALADLGVMAASRQQRRLGDWIADTVVIMEAPDREARLKDWNDYWLRRDAETDWRQLPPDLAAGTVETVFKRARARVLRERKAGRRGRVDDTAAAPE